MRDLFFSAEADQQSRTPQMQEHANWVPSIPVPVIFSKWPGDPVGFDTGAFFYLQRRPALRRNKAALLLSTIKWALNCTDDALVYLFSTARRRILQNIQGRVSELEAIVAECVHMDDVAAEAIQAQCLVPIEAELNVLQEETLELGRLRQACANGANAVVGRNMFFKHILPCALHVFKTTVYAAWIKEVALYSRAGLFLES